MILNPNMVVARLTDPDHCRIEDTAKSRPLRFSFGRSIQHPALVIWHGDDKNIEAAQRALMNRAAFHHAALRGEYGDAMEGKL